MSERKRITFDTVREMGLKLPGTEVGTAYGTPVLRVNGRIFAGIAINREAEPHSLMVCVRDFEERDSLLGEDPETYYLKPHYEGHPVVLVRLERVTREALEDLVRGAHRAISSKLPARARRRTRAGFGGSQTAPQRRTSRGRH